jgi:threonyl-tRNA synthetase
LNFVPESVYYWVLNIEYNIIDELGRPREIGTVQIDIGNAQRFGISYTDKNGDKSHPAIIHSALIGTVERYIFAVLDTAVQMQKRGEIPSLPLWLAPVQVRIIPIKEDIAKEALKLASELMSHHIRVDVDDRSESIPRRVRDAETSWIPYIIVFGEKELKSQMLTVRCRMKSAQIRMTKKMLVSDIHQKTEGYPTRPLTMPIFLSQRPVYKSSQ